MDITPNVNLLRSLRGERTNYVALIGEGIDNAFDAGATSVSITFDDDSIVFEDDGRGITKKLIGAMFSLGEHGRMTTTQLGRFGVGIKSQAVNAGDVMVIQSASQDGRVRAKVNWRDVLEAGLWNIQDPHWFPIQVGSRTGTAITISKLRHRPPRNTLSKVREDIALRFYPALRDGKRITLNGEAIEVLPEPEMTDIVEVRMNLSGGRSAHLRAGILVSPGRLSKVHVSFRHRVIMPGSAVGCDGYGGLVKMFARLQIFSDNWHLGKFKDDLTDEGEVEELEDAVAIALQPILEKCSAASFSARVVNLQTRLNDMLPEELAARRPNRKKKHSVSAVEKRRNGTGSVAPDESTVGGPARSKASPRDSLLITFDGVAAKDGVGEYARAGRKHRVNLSGDHPHIAKLIALRDECLALECLLALALAIFEEAKGGNQPELPFESFGVRISRQLSAQEGPLRSEGTAA